MSRGPVQYFVFAFPGNQSKGEIVPALQAVVAQQLIRIVDIAFARKDAAGAICTMELNDLNDEEFNAFAELVDHTEGLLSDDDIVELAAEIPPDSSVALLVFEHVWATQLASAILNANGRVVKQGFVPHEIVEEVLQLRNTAG